MLDRLGANVVGITSLVDRGGGGGLPVPYEAMLAVEAPTWTPDECPLCAEGGTPVKPGGAKRKQA